MSEILGPLIGLQEIATYTSLSKHTIYKLNSEHKLPSRRYYFGRAVRFRKADIEAWIQEHQKIKGLS